MMDRKHPGLLFITLLIVFLLTTASSAMADKAKDFSLGNRLMRHNQYLEAIEVFQALARSAPDYAVRAQLAISECYRSLDRHSDAIEHYNAGLILATSCGDQQALPPLRTGLAHAYYSAGMYEDVLRICQSADAMRPEQRDYLIARCHLMVKDYDKALLAYDRLLATYPSSPKAVRYSIDRLECLAFLRKFEDLCTDLKSLLADHPNANLIEGKTGDALSSTLEQVGLKGSRHNAECVADALFSRLSVDSALTPRVRSALACVLLNARRADDAVALMRAGAGVSDTLDRQAEWLRQAAVVLYDVGRYSDAIAGAESALAVGSSTAEPGLRYLIALSRLGLGDKTTAITLLREIADRFPDTEPGKAAIKRLSVLRVSDAEAPAQEVSK